MNALSPDEDVQLPETVPVMPSQDAVLYPMMILPLTVVDQNLTQLVSDAVAADKLLALFAVDAEAEAPESEDLPPVGTLASIARMMKLPDGNVQLLLQGLRRVRLTEITQQTPYWRARLESVDESFERDLDLEARMRNLTNLFQRATKLAPGVPQEIAVAAMNIEAPGQLADFVAANINLSLDERQDVLETVDVRQRIDLVTRLLTREVDILELGSRIQSQVKDEMNKSQREYYLRQQLRAIQKELGETDEREAELARLGERLNEAGLPEEARTAAHRELERLATMPPGAAEATMVRTYLEWMTDLPWSKGTDDHIDLSDAERILNEDHYDLEKIKDRILEFLAVRKVKPDSRGSILCFAGPPGVGKTSLGQSIARAMGRNFVRMSLGGVRDEAEIRGHRRTYIGALPGRVIQSLRRAGSNNPVFMLDEVDKVGADWRGDPSSALLEVLDPAQNDKFIDHYLDVPFDLSRVLFIATANVLDTIPGPLRDRMEVLQISGYTEQEKMEIARRYLLPRQLKEHALSEQQLQIEDSAIQKIIQNYTREAGVRSLEREIGAIARKAIRRVAGGSDAPPPVTADNLADYLGPVRVRYEITEARDEIGVATGMAWTEVGGDVLFVEAALVPGRGNLQLTGKLGEVMQESAKAALTYARSRATFLGADEKFHEKFDIHIHVPAGAIPKDGPSAGVTIATAIISALTLRPIRKDVAMTGEVTLRGKVLPVGGIRDKVLAAHRAGARVIILPKDNERDIEDIPAEIRHDLEFRFVGHMDQVLEHALSPENSMDALELQASAAAGSMMDESIAANSAKD